MFRASPPTSPSFLRPSFLRTQRRLRCFSKPTTRNHNHVEEIPDQVADVLTYIRNSWGNSASAVGAETIKSSVKPWSSAAIDRVLGEIDHPNNRKHNHDRGDAEAKHKPDMMPDHSLPGLSRRYH
jgi:hypothetical protein